MQTQETNKNLPRASILVDFYKQLKGARANFESYWQSLHDFFYLEAEDINTQYAPGAELRSDSLYDSTTLQSADVLASGFMNYLTPPTSKWFKLRSKNPQLTQNKEVSDYLESVSDEVYHALNKSNYYNQMFPTYKSSGVFGTSVLLEEEDIDTDVRFNSLPIKQVYIVEDARGNVAEFFIETEYTAKQAAERWGAENLSESFRAEIAAETRKEKKHLFILYIAKRSRRDITKTDKRNLPIEAAWINVEDRKFMEEGGYHEMPSMCHRFDKRPFIPWGFSPAMKALPFARMLNAAAKTNMRAMMKHTDPPLALPNNAFIMPFNGNPRAVNYYNKKYMDSGKDIFSFANTGNPQIGLEAVAYYSQQVKSLMYNDIFLAFDNLTKQMNNPEIMERINEKMSMLGPAVGRYIAEMLNPIVIRTIGILARRGKLPPPPDAIIQDPQYEIDSISQLAQSQRRSELNSLVTGLGMVAQIAQFDPNVLDKINSDDVVDEAWSIIGAPSRVLRDDAEVQEIRQAKNQAAVQQQQMAMAVQGADIVEKGSKVDLNLAKAQGDKKK